MDEPRDDVDIWLSERVKPLLPHPGTFERIRKRARRRKLAQVAVAAGGAAVIVAAALTVPHFVISPLSPTSNSVGPAASRHPTPASSTHPSTPKPSPSSPAPSPSAAPAGPPAVPPNFAASSVTFVSASTGWVIGQAGTPGQCTGPNPDICTSIAATFTGGSTWQGVPAPVTGPPDGARGVSQVRSLNGADGWAFGPQLYTTHDGGQTWTKIATHGMRVTDLETVAGRAFAVWARCTGTGPDFAASCNYFSLYSTPAGVNRWAPVRGATGLTSNVVAGGSWAASSAQLVLTGSRGYLLAPDGEVYSGPVSSAGAWSPPTANGTTLKGCGLPGPAQANGVPSLTMLATTGPYLVELCLAQTPGRPQTKLLAYSADGGRTWQSAGFAPRGGLATSLSGTPAGQVLVATTTGIDVSANAVGEGSSSLRWRAVRGASLAGGFSYVGMTTSVQGVAVPADQSVHAVWFTYDGGHHWQESPLR